MIGSNQAHGRDEILFWGSMGLALAEGSFFLPKYGLLNWCGFTWQHLSEWESHVFEEFQMLSHNGFHNASGLAKKHSEFQNSNNINGQKWLFTWSAQLILTFKLSVKLVIKNS